MAHGRPFGPYPVLNSGAFSIPGAAKHWSLWADALRQALQRSRHKLMEQTALNLVLYQNRADITILPAYCNWLCDAAAPSVDDDDGLLVEPFEPHQALGIVHLAGEFEREGELDLRSIAGREVRTRLTFEGVDGKTGVPVPGGGPTRPLAAGGPACKRFVEQKGDGVFIEGRGSTPRESSANAHFARDPALFCQLTPVGDKVGGGGSGPLAGRAAGAPRRRKGLGQQHLLGPLGLDFDRRDAFSQRLGALPGDFLDAPLSPRRAARNGPTTSPCNGSTISTAR